MKKAKLLAILVLVLCLSGSIYNNALSEAEIADLSRTSSDANADYLAPIAYAMIGSNGTVLSGTPNVTCTFLPDTFEYEITIADENYVWSDYVTVVTVSYGGAGIIPVNSSGDGKLYVWIYTLDGFIAKADFQFVTYKSPPPKEQNIIVLTDVTFDEIVLNSDVPVLVDFYADWCGACGMMTSVIQEIADEYAGIAKICTLNIDDCPVSISNYGIEFIPTFILFNGGEVQQEFVGVRSKEELTAAIDELL